MKLIKKEANTIKEKSLVKNLKLKAAALALSSAFILTGCGHELAPVEEYDTVSQDQSDDNGLLSIGLTQTLDIPGEDFKLVTEYTCDSATKRSWRVTSDKFLYFNVYTKGLSSDVQIYIDNVHIDTSIKSKYASMDGILQDTMDDHIHNSCMIGFPVDDDTNYYGVFAVEGCNQDFIQGSFYGYSGMYSGDVTEKRYTEEDYQDWGVYANKFQIVYDLLVKGPNDNDFKNISVSTDFLVPVTQVPINYEDENGKTYTKEQ